MGIAEEQREDEKETWERQSPVERMEGGCGGREGEVLDRAKA